MSVNVGGRGSPVSFQDLQDFYGGSHPISLSEYYRGGAEVPSTAISGNNPYTGTTSFSASGNGNGGNDGISVNVQNNDTSSSSTSTQTISGSTAGLGRSTFTVNTGGPATARGVIHSNDGSAQLQSGGNTVAFTPGPGTVNVTYNNGQTYTLFQGSSTASWSYPRTTTTTTTVSRRRATFTNSTGQNITLNTTFMGGNARSATLARGGSIDTGILNGGSEAWTFSYDIIDAGTGSGSADANVANINVDVTTIPAVAGGTIASGNNDLNFDIGETSLGGGAFQTGSTGAVPANAFYVRLGAFLSGAVGGLTSGTIRNNRSGSTFGFSGGGGGINSNFYFEGPVFANNDGSSPPRDRNGFPLSHFGINTSAFPGGIQAGDTFSITACSGFRCGAVTLNSGVRLRPVVTNQPRPETNDVTFRNNTGSDIILSSGSSGGSRTLSAGAQELVIDDAASPAWRFDYRYAPSSQPANTAIPTDPDPNTPGPEISLDEFNTPGNAAG